MKEALTRQIEAALDGLLKSRSESIERPSVELEVPRQAEHGDFSCNIAMLLAKPLKSKPREIADDLRERLADAEGLLEAVEIAGPGFLNFRLKQASWQGLVHEILRAGRAYGTNESGEGASVQVEFVSANPTGPLSTGHGRQAILGDCIARLLERMGYQVTREYYFNDGGRQMRVLGESVKARYLEELGRAAPPPPEALAGDESAWSESVDGLPVAFPRGGYQGEYIREIAKGLLSEHGDRLLEEPGDGLFREVAQQAIFEEINRTLEALGIVFDVYWNEKSLYEDGKIEEVVEELRTRGLVYEKEGAVWLAATQLGLDRDRVIVKSTGEPTYLLPDIAYHREKFARGFDGIIDVQGADHVEQFPFVREAIRALDLNSSRLELVMHQFVTITSQGEKVKQSTRKATFITVDELVDQVGRDVFRFFMIERKAEGHLDFDLDLARDQNWRKNPAYYVQYGHARTYGIERKAKEAGVRMPAPDAFDAGRLELPEELELVRKLGEFPELVGRAAETREPHHIAYFLRDLAGLWNPYIQDGQRHRVLSDDQSLTAARLGLVLAVRHVLAAGLDVLGVSAPEAM
ncbi:MAG: arginine--tRNA ligase [bacterium TMED88]|nr:arginine--tRNA ligase [Deltaproteobacteria bacterium]OUV28765.1 MAG: arginine--tRNA ligase [bacterium TMED88]